MVFVMVGGVVFEMETIIFINTRSVEADGVVYGVEFDWMYGKVDDKPFAVDDFA